MLKKSFKRRGGLIPLLFLFFIFSYSSAFSNNNDKCKTCHIIESDQNHSFGCIECHGGDKDTKDKNLAHKMMFGGKNPSNKFDMDKTCGKCHYYQIIRVKTSIMFTNTGIINKLKKALATKENVSLSFLMGIINKLKKALGKEDNKIHSLNPGENYNEKGIPATFYDVTIDNGKNYKVLLKNGTNFVLTNKKLPFSNVYEKDGKYYLIKKRDGKIFELKIITNNTNHNIIGHERLECYTCHSRTVPQCYGCHTFYDKRFETKDFIKKEVTNGAFYEKEGFRIAYLFPLGVNHKNRVSPITPGCQTNLYLIDEKGYFIAEKVVPKIDNKINYKFAPIYSHNTGKKALKCEECHYNPFFAGFGYTLFSKNDKAITGKVLCEKSATGNLDSFITVNKGGLKTSMTILREIALPLNKDEILKLIKPSLCIICHRSSDDKIYRSKLDYNIDDPLHRKYLK